MRNSIRFRFPAALIILLFLAGCSSPARLIRGAGGRVIASEGSASCPSLLLPSAGVERLEQTVVRPALAKITPKDPNEFVKALTVKALVYTYRPDKAVIEAMWADAGRNADELRRCTAYQEKSFFERSLSALLDGEEYSSFQRKEDPLVNLYVFTLAHKSGQQIKNDEAVKNVGKLLFKEALSVPIPAAYSASPALTDRFRAAQLLAIHDFTQKFAARTSESLFTVLYEPFSRLPDKKAYADSVLRVYFSHAIATNVDNRTRLWIASNLEDYKTIFAEFNKQPSAGQDLEQKLHELLSVKRKSPQKNWIVAPEEYQFAYVAFVRAKKTETRDLILEIMLKDAPISNSASALPLVAEKLKPLLNNQMIEQYFSIYSSADAQAFKLSVRRILLKRSFTELDADLLVSKYRGLGESNANILLREWASAAKASKEMSRIHAKLKSTPHANDFAVAKNLAHLELNGKDLDAAQIVERQNEIEAGLKDQLLNYIQANAPPEPFALSARPWGHFIARLPAEYQYEAVKLLLQKNGGSTSSITNMIRQLEPSAPAVRAVNEFLSDCRFMNSNRSDFSSEQVRSMFGGERFNAFFPWLGANPKSTTYRTNFIVAVKTNPYKAGRWNKEWIREKFDDPDIRVGIAALFGFRPAFSHDRFSTQLGSHLADSEYYKNSPAEQIRGLVVQAGYELQSHTLMFRLTGRGDSHVEALAPTINRQIESELSLYSLSKESNLVRKLFVNGWYVSSDSNLISNIRNRAIRVANSNGSFWNLRVEIHNFPTRDTLRRVKEYFSERSGSMSRPEELRTLIAEIETLLGTGAHRQGSLASDWLKMLPMGETSLATMLEEFGSVDGVSPAETLHQIAGMRASFLKIKAEGSSSRKNIESIIGDTILSQYAMSEASRLVEAMTAQNWYEAASAMLEHVRLDGLLTQTQFDSVSAALMKIRDAENIAPLRGMEMASDLIQNAVDQVYYGLDGEFSRYDVPMYASFRAEEHPPVRFVDNVMRSTNVLLLGRLSDRLQEMILIEKKFVHGISGSQTSEPIRVLNPGSAVGVLRYNKNPMELSPNDIAVFEEMPEETAPLGGIITLGVGARLSHLQLLAKALNIPNVNVARSLAGALKALDGKMVRYSVARSGKVSIEEESVEGVSASLLSSKSVTVPEPDFSQSAPIDFTAAARTSGIAGPKGLMLAKMLVSPSVGTHVPDGFIIPFGFFKRYSDSIGLTPWLDLLSKLRLENRHLIASVIGRIRAIIESNPLPPDLLDEVKASLGGLKQRTGHEGGYFFRSDTNIEDLPNFNGAGLNKSIPNVLIDDKAIDQAVRRVWQSPFTEKSVFWRAMALDVPTVTVAYPSIVVMPTVQARSSGVILSRGTARWVKGKGFISANFGIGSVVEAGKPVEEITLESGQPIRTSYTVTTQKPVANASGGLTTETVESGSVVLDDELVNQLNGLAVSIEETLGDSEHGWDIEWAVDANGKVKILQARPNM